MRRVWVVAVMMAMLGLAGCTTAPEDGDDRPMVLTTFTVIADIARNVAGDRLRVESITKIGAEIHGYEPTPQDVAHASDAALILDNGLGLEAWFEQFVSETDVPHAVLTEHVEPIDIAADAYAGHPNPHAWMSPLNVIAYVEVMVAAFSDLDPEGADTFEANA
uniref:metal ABC transporter solute-binding protein, Zn/Mn family n=1 Tax=Pseudactinotalea sp. TaxID=1926260 RepID=UPI003B3B1847